MTTNRLTTLNQDLIQWGTDDNHPNRMIVCTTNLDIKRDGKAVMGAGLAKAVRDAFPGIDAEYGEILQGFAAIKSAKLGVAPTSKPLDLPKETVSGHVFTSRRFPVVFMPTKGAWQAKSQENFVLANLKALRSVIQELRHLEFGVPLVGAGLGELSPEWAELTINTVLGDLPNARLIDTRVREAPAQLSIQEIRQMVASERVLVVSGHRPDKLGGYSPEIRHHLRDLAQRILLKHGTTMLVHGGALGVDKAFADAAEELGLKVIYAEPCLNSDKRWREHDREVTRRQIKYAEATGAHVIVTPEEYSPEVMQRRNEWMVDLLAFAGEGSAFTCIYDGTPGGTKNCRDYFFGKFGKSKWFGNHWMNFLRGHPLPSTVAGRPIERFAQLRGQPGLAA